jgi:outer membrane protein assembly factor BamB
LAVTRVGGVDMSPSVVVGTREGVAVLGAMAGDTAGTGRVALLDAVDWAVVASATVSGLPHGAQTAAVAGRTLVIGDWMGEAPESNALVVLDGRTLEPIARLRVGVAPCALAGYGDRLLVVDRSEGVLRCVDPVSGVVDWSVDLGANGLLCSAVLVFDGPSD